MKRISRDEAEALAERILSSLRPVIVQAVADALDGPAGEGDDAEGLSPQDLARVERSASSWRRKAMGGKSGRRPAG